MSWLRSAEAIVESYPNKNIYDFKIDLNQS